MKTLLKLLRIWKIRETANSANKREWDPSKEQYGVFNSLEELVKAKKGEL